MDEVTSHVVAFLISPGVNMIDLGGPMQAFSTCNTLAKRGTLYEIITASAQGGAVQTAPGLMLPTTAIAQIDPSNIDTLVVPGGSNGGQPPENNELAHWISANSARIGRICSVCTGAFLLGQAGILSGRRVATHWRWAEELQRRYPEAHVELDPIYIEDKNVWTSAGVSAGIDLALALIARDQGRATAMAVARNLVVYITRSGGQAQFSVPLEAQSASGNTFADLEDWILNHLTMRLDIATLANRVGMSERSFRRKYHEATGRTPMRAVEAFRLEAASQSLISTMQSVKQIARAVGCETENNLLRLFRRHYGITPVEFRQRFSKQPENSADP